MNPAVTDPAADALLQQARALSRGRLKIFLGAAPGVGKTYAMLRAAQSRRNDGVDTVAGIIETHGRRETQALLGDLEILPRKSLPHRGQMLEELDLDALIARKPSLALVDELAHTNAPGSRHIKRYQDVQEILAAGIDVYTTLNVQHLESLNDTVARITRVQVQETLPDEVLKQADEIELIDLPPDDLIQRLQDGKVYLPEQARRAQDHFFSRGNLTALRELAMRAAAERVDADVLRHMQAHGVQGPWPVSDRLMVCVGGDTVSRNLIRAAARIAGPRRVPWTAVHVINSRANRLPDAEKDRIAASLRLAQELGGEAVTIPGENVAGELLRYARNRNVSQIIAARPQRSRLPWFAYRSVTRELIRQSAGFDITLVTVSDETARQEIQTEARPEGRLTRGAVLMSGLAVIAATLFSLLLKTFVPLDDFSLIYLLAVLLVAFRYGQAAAYLSAGLSFLAFNLLFMEPHLTFAVTHHEDWVTLLFFAAIAIITGRLAAQMHGQMQALRKTARRQSNLNEFSRQLAGALSEEPLCRVIVEHVRATLECSCVALTAPPDERLNVVASAGISADYQFTQLHRAAAAWSWEHSQAAGWSSSTLPKSEWLFVPMRAARSTVGVLGLLMTDRRRPFSSGQRRLLEAIGDQAAVALERVRLSGELERSRVITEAESLRTALLSSVSHDLRTPLVSVIGSAESLLEYGNKLKPNERVNLARNILEEAERLNGFVQNLLDMTRLGHGVVKPRLDWCEFDDLLAEARKRLARVLDGRRLQVDVARKLPLLQVDPLLMQQVLINLLDNAVKYTPANGVIRVSAERVSNRIRIRVCDEGPGIPADKREAIFDPFFRVKAQDQRRAGTGLGLSICRGFVEAHGGSIRATDSPNGLGVCLEILMPVDEPPPEWKRKS